jgi:hypothetical protein
MAKVKTKPKNGSSLPAYLLIGAGVLLLAVVIFIALQGTGGNETTSEFPQQEGADSIPRTSVEEAKTAFDKGTAVFVDVRGDDAYALGHVAGALSIPLSSVESRLGELDAGKWIIPYCT